MGFTGKTTADFMVRFTGRSGRTWQGKVEHVQSGQVQFFQSELELWRLIQMKLDETGSPQATMKMRSWSDIVGKDRY